jgi:hypothetical protein
LLHFQKNSKIILMMKFLQKNLLAAFIAVAIAPQLSLAQSGGCIEIRSILVDACGSPEGENEMVRFDIGNSLLNVANMTVTWPNNTFQGLCQDAATAAIVSAVNQNIVGCGMLTEPSGGVLPANSKILLLTSTNINTIANTFENLNDTVIVLFQCAGNTSGHFANYNLLPGLRTLSIQFNGPSGCTDSVTYDRTQLVNQFGVIGGFSFENDGAFVEFSTTGVPAYLNHGCQVLSTGLSLTGGPDAGICPGGSSTATLNASGTNINGNPQWSGGTGVFSSPNSLTTTYTPGASETGIVYLTVTGNGPCNASITDTVRVNIVNALPVVSITGSVSGVFNSNITDPNYFYNWYPDGSSVFIPGAFSPSFIPNTNGCYYMILSTVGGCSATSNTLCITNVGLNEAGLNSQLQIYNNPGSSPSIMLNSAFNSSVLTVNIIDIYGRIISEQKISNRKEFTPDWSGIAAGLYLVRLYTEEFQYEGKIILTK